MCKKKKKKNVFRWSGTWVTGEMVLDGRGQFIPAGIVGLHTLPLLLASLVAHDRATEDNHTHTEKELNDRTLRPILYTIRGYST